MPPPPRFWDKSSDAIRAELAGFPDTAIESALRFREDRAPASLETLVLAMLHYYRPGNLAAPTSPLPPEMRFREELGVDSLTLTEMVFKLDELLGVPIELREIAEVQTLGGLQEFLRDKLQD